MTAIRCMPRLRFADQKAVADAHRGRLRPLIAGQQSLERLEALIAALESPAFLGHPWLRWPVPPSTSPLQEGFHRRSYWRGPTWPVINWLLWWSLLRAAESKRAQQLRQASLQQPVIGGFGEYFDPFTGELLGANDQSWTAGVALDWLASHHCRALRPTATVLQPGRYKPVRSGHTDWPETAESA
jgi:hypothetical protein